MRKTVHLLLAGLACVAILSANAQASIQITEWMYDGTNGEFVEFTNVGSVAIDMTNWSYSDSARIPGSVQFGSTFGVVQPGESVIFTEVSPDAFRAAWNLSSSVKIFGPNSVQNIGRADEIHIYDANGVEVDFLVYNDQVGWGPRARYQSCNIPLADYGLTTASSSWQLATVGDAFGSWRSTGNDIGSPGIAPVPEPASLAALTCGLMGLVGIRRRK